MIPRTRHMIAVVVLWVAALLAAYDTHAAGMGVDDARHLLTRTGFSPTIAEIDRFAALSREEGVARILDGVRTRPVTQWPAELDQLPDFRALRAMSEPQRRQFNRDERARGADLRAWWLGEMIATPSPFTERMTLFWHNHFVSSQDKVHFQKLMLQQNLTLREQAVGNFGKLLFAASKDPAMLVYLDARNSKKAQPNENFAREVMELFTLGEGHYSERDIKEAARAFTGWDLNRRDGEFSFNRREHDAGEKEIFGQRGRFDGDDVLRLLLARRETSEFITTKLWREFVSPTPDAAEVRRIASLMRERDYELKPVMRALLLSPAFWAPQTRGALVKSPVELVVGSLRTFEGEIGDPIVLVRPLHQMGQDLFAPPNVRGWPGGEWWINSTTLLDRKQFLDRLSRADDLRRVPRNMRAVPAAPPAPGDASAADMARREAMRERISTAMQNMDFDLQGWSAEARARGYTPEQLLLPIPPVDSPSMMQREGLAALRSALLDPAYQLK